MARTAAAAILQDIITKGHLLDERFSPKAVPNRLQSLDARDQSLTRSIVTASLRRLGTVRGAIATRLAQGLPRQAPEIEWTLIVAATQILFLEIPDHAAVDLAVRAVRLEKKSAPFAGLVNATLRSIARARDAILAESDPLDQDVPAWLAARWRKTYGETTAHAIAAAIREEPTLDITVKSHAEEWAVRLGARILPTGSLRVGSHRPVTELDGYAEGAWWVQDAAAALPASLLPLQPGMRVADFCAAPGGKAAQLAAAGVQLTAIDRSAERLRRLSANLERLGLTAELVVADATSFKSAPFDAVLVDAPCLGTGTLRRHPDIAWTKKPGDLAALTALQSRLLDKAVEMTVPGGTIVYCTCSIEPEEGENQIAALLRRNPDVMRSPIAASEIGGLGELINAQGELRSLPSHLAGPEPRFAGIDGFFAARLKRRG
ncbi:MAG: transcription antitermination factor NusB [Beijerinckiaceae bacterium]|nr:transcription antitermination factor NusB [Beijerinckiaceae bacterium]